MKKECLLLCLAAFAPSAFPAPTNAPSETEKKALDVLRETIYQYERRRGTMLPPPTLSTNAVNTNAAVKPPASTNIVKAPGSTNPVWITIPSKPIPPPSSAPLATRPLAAKPPPKTNTPPPTTAMPIPNPSAKTISPPSIAAPFEPTTTAHETSVAELERLYLEGKITAKQFQKYLKQQEEKPRAAVTPITPPPSEKPKETAAAKPTPPPKKLPPPEVRTPPPAASPDQSAISEVERKMDELIRLKNAREQATNVSTTATNSASGPKTQRQKLDELLKQLVDGKISDAEYKTKREQILNEPAPKK